MPDFENDRHGEKVEYSASNPHPGFGKDPNIKNELGHTHYPMWIDHPTEKVEGTKFPKRVIVESEDAHLELVPDLKKEKGKGWGNK